MAELDDNSYRPPPGTSEQGDGAVESDGVSSIKTEASGSLSITARVSVWIGGTIGGVVGGWLVMVSSKAGFLWLNAPDRMHAPLVIWLNLIAYFTMGAALGAYGGSVFVMVVRWWVCAALVRSRRRAPGRR